MNIILTGLRGSGKTTIGKLLADKLKRKFIDLDEEIEKTEKMKIADIVTKHDWKYFREIEAKTVKKLQDLDNHVIATGGGTLMNPKNATILKKNSLIILLTCELESLQKRLEDEGENRPSITGKQDFLSEIPEIWEERRETYEKIADFTFETTHEPFILIAKEIAEIL